MDCSLGLFFYLNFGLIICTGIHITRITLDPEKSFVSQQPIEPIERFKPIDNLRTVFERAASRCLYSHPSAANNQRQAIESTLLIIRA